MEPGRIEPPALKANATALKAQSKLGRHRFGVRLALLALIVAGGLLLHGAARGAVKDKQPTRRIVSGTVYDDAQNIIFGATVELKDTQTGKALDIYSQENGEYQYSDLRFDHDYTIQAMYKGASSEPRKISMFDTRWHLVINLTIPKSTH
jgi:hypothetical protein